MARPSKRQFLLDAACLIVAEKGAQALTLEAVAAAAGVSKGGLLYHFSTKRALVFGMVDRAIEAFESQLDRRSVAAFLQTYVQAATTASVSGQQRSAAVVAAAALEPAALQRLDARMAAWAEFVVAEAADPDLALVVVMAADGIWYANTVRPTPADDAYAAVRARLLDLARVAAG